MYSQHTMLRNLAPHLTVFTLLALVITFSCLPAGAAAPVDGSNPRPRSLCTATSLGDECWVTGSHLPGMGNYARIVTVGPDGSVYAGGQFETAGVAPAEPLLEPSALRVASLATGTSHTCALLEGGSVMCWGNNAGGQIGDGTTLRRDSATAVLGLDQSATTIAAGGAHTCALMQDGTLRCWGSNGSGQLGDGTKTDHTLPVAVQGLTRAITAVSLGDSHTCALDVDGGVWCWGENYNGQLGDGGMDDRTLPALVGGLAPATAVAAGRDHTCALAQGQAYCWGSNTQGQLGDGTDMRRRQPVRVVGLGDGVAAIKAGGSHSCAVTSTSGLMCWGYNWYGQLGDGTTTARYVPVSVIGLGSGVQQITAGGNHSCALQGGSLTCWGYNWYGQVGDGTTTDRSWPVGVLGLDGGVTAVGAGSIHTCALTSSAGAKCWGSNYYGQLGNGTHLGMEYTPVDVVGLEGDAAADPLTLLDDLSLRTEAGHWPPSAGDQTIAHIRVQNTSGGPLHVEHLGVRGRRNGSESWDIGFWTVDLAAGQEWTLDPNNERPLEEGSYAFRISYSLDGTTWTEIGNEVTFTVEGGGGVTPTPGPSPTPPQGEVEVRHIEITQAIQDETNSVPLIAGKPTFARVYVRAPAGQSISSVAGVLRGFGPSGELPGSPLLPVNRSVTAYDEDWDAQRGDLRKTLNFTLPMCWTSGMVTLRAEVGSAVLTPDPLVFQPTDPLRVVYVPIRYQGREPDSARIRTSHSWAQRVFPTHQVEYVPGNQAVEWNMCLDKGQCPNLYAPSARLLQLRLSTLALLQDRYVFGWLPEGSYGGGLGIGIDQGRAAFGDDHSVIGPRLFAHEMAHLLGRRHPSRECPGEPLDPDTDWPQEYPDSTIQTFGLDGWGFGWLISSNSALKNPAVTYDYMSYCEPLSMERVWTSPWTYERLSDRLQSQGTSALLAGESTPRAIVSGIVYSSGQATIEPVWVVEGSGESVTPPAGSTYCLEFHDAAGTPMVQQCFDLDFRDPATYEPGDMAIYSLRLPYPAGTARVVLRSGSQELASRTVSTSVPEVTVLAPAAGETWNEEGTSSVAWAATDADGDPLAFYVMYSHDGEDWIPVSGPITETQVALDVSRLPGSEAARIRVLASDGARTGMGESGLFSTGRKAPSVDILAPESAGSVQPETELLLQGWAHDLEDGVLEGASLTWRSDVDGDLGTGTTILVSLSPGHHTVSLGATDSDGNTTVASTQVSVGQWVYLPLSLKQ